MISPERIEQVVQAINSLGLNPQTPAALRARFCDLHFTYCDDDDIGIAQPVRAMPNCNLYLVEGRSHCLQLTTDHAAATGLVIAAR